MKDRNSSGWLQRTDVHTTMKLKQSIYVLVGQLVIAGCGFAGFYILSRPLLHLFGLSEYGVGVVKIALILIFVCSVAIGAIVGMFLFPVVLRPFVTSEEFWNFINAKEQRTTTGLEPLMKLLDPLIKLLDPLMERWAVFLYGNCNRADLSRH